MPNRFLFTNKEIAAIRKLHKEAKEGTFAKRLAAEILPPIMPRMNKALNKVSDPLFVAYVIEYKIVTKQL
jgi:hypothetical protein